MSALVEQATSKIGAILGALSRHFTLAQLEVMAQANDLSPLQEPVRLAYAHVAETALGLFLLGLHSVARTVRAGFVPDTTHGRITSSQASLRGMLADTLAADQMNVLWHVLGQSRNVSPKLAAVRLRNALGLTGPLASGVITYEKVLAQPTKKEMQTGDLVTTEQLSVMTGARATSNRRFRASVMGLAEAQRAYGRAQLEAWSQAVEAGVVRGATRLWVMGPNTRDSHQHLNGQVRDLRTPFESGHGNMLMYPCDMAAPVEDVAGCNCSLQYTEI